MEWFSQHGNFWFSLFSSSSSFSSIFLNSSKNSNLTTFFFLISQLQYGHFPISKDFSQQSEHECFLHFVQIDIDLWSQLWQILQVINPDFKIFCFKLNFCSSVIYIFSNLFLWGLLSIYHWFPVFMHSTFFEFKVITIKFLCILLSLINTHGRSRRRTSLRMV